MDITINELEQLMPDSYRLLDMRGDVEVGHGMIPGAIHMSRMLFWRNIRVDL